MARGRLDTPPRKSLPRRRGDSDPWEFLRESQEALKFLYCSPRGGFAAVGESASARAALTGAGVRRLRKTVRRAGAGASNGDSSQRWWATIPFETGAKNRLTFHLPSRRIEIPAAPASRPSTHHTMARTELSWSQLPSQPVWNRHVEAILNRLRPGRLDKVVLSRRIRARLSRPIDPVGLAQALQRASPRTTTFLVQEGERALVGSSPELVARRQQGRIETVALAGTSLTPTGATSLTADPKIRREHGFVQHHIESVLDDRGLPWRRTREPRPQRFPHLHHLETRYEAESGPGDHVLGLVARLHPTPALAGWPVAAARRTLRALEGRPRGAYAGLVGWLDANGDGEFVAALRMAELTPRSVTLQAGAGIVDGSTPEGEWEETEAKFRLLRRLVEEAP